MSGTLYVARAANVAARMIGGEMMIMSGLDSSLCSLNETATVLWQAADGVTPLDRIVERHICGLFDVDIAVALQDARALAGDLASIGILDVSDAPITASKEPS